MEYPKASGAPRIGRLRKAADEAVSGTEEDWGQAWDPRWEILWSLLLPPYSLPRCLVYNGGLVWVAQIKYRFRGLEGTPVPNVGMPVNFTVAYVADMGLALISATVGKVTTAPLLLSPSSLCGRHTTIVLFPGDVDPEVEPPQPQTRSDMAPLGGTRFPKNDLFGCRCCR